jgi:enoyl-CoA hydratase
MATKAPPIEGAIVERRGEVGWIILKDYEATMKAAYENPSPDFRHTALIVAEALHEFRFDPEIRVVVLTGENDGEFYRVVRATGYENQKQRDRLNPVKLKGWGGGMVTRIYETLALMEKPVIARLNGDAIGLGQALLWGCDFIVARDDAVVADVHTGQGDVIDSNGEVRGFPWAVTPGDGAMSFAPLYMTPTKLKEYMFLSRTWTTKQLADMNIINYAVPAAELDDTVNEIIEKILARPAYVIAHAKRVCNKHMVNQLNLAQDLASAYEGLDFFTHASAGDMD